MYNFDANIVDKIFESSIRQATRQIRYVKDPLLPIIISFKLEEVSTPSIEPTKRSDLPKRMGGILPRRQLRKLYWKLQQKGQRPGITLGHLPNKHYWSSSSDLE